MRRGDGKPMSDTKKPTMSEIRERDQSAPGGARFDVPYLLDLVERMGKVIDATTVWCGDDPCYRTRNGVPQRMPLYAERIMKQSRALLQELKQ